MRNVKKIGIVILARCNSRRFPGKSLTPLSNMPVLDIILKRLDPIRAKFDIVVATSHKDIDNPIADWCAANLVSIFRGSSEDVLGRFLSAAQTFHLDFAFRVNGDSPLIDVELIKKAGNFSRLNNYDLVTTRGGKLPYGIGIELVNIPTICRLYEYSNDSDKEHVTSILYRFKARIKYQHPAMIDISDLNFAVDYVEDITRIERMVNLVANSSILTVTYRDFINLRRLGIV